MAMSDPYMSIRRVARQMAVTGLTLSGAARIAVAAAKVRSPRNLEDHASLSLTDRFKSAERVMIFAHHDPMGQVSEADWNLIDAFRVVGWSVGLSTTMSCVHEELVASCAGRVDAICTRDNRGFDFGSWARLLEPLLRTPRLPRRVVLLNNSVYGPAHPIDRTVERIETLGWAVTGMTGSREFLPHASSYFMAFDDRVMSDPRFLSWWRSIRVSDSKWGAILSHELRWLRDFGQMAHGSAGILFPPSRGVLRNPSSTSWHELVRIGMPFVKKSLFGPNYDRIDLTGWGLQLQDAAPSFDVGLVESDLRRLGLPVPETGLP
jgi:hypothetical protein